MSLVALARGLPAYSASAGLDRNAERAWAVFARLTPSVAWLTAEEARDLKARFIAAMEENFAQATTRAYVAARAARVGAVAVVEGELAGVAQVAPQRGPAAVEG